MPTQPRAVFLVPPCAEAVTEVWADARLRLVAKPAGLLSVPGRDPRNRDSVLGRLAAAEPGLRVIHRLDLDTSGLLLLARDAAAQAALQRQFEARTVAKEYTALVAGLVAADAGEIDLSLICDWPRRPRQRVCQLTGKPSQTRWRVLERDAGAGLTRLLLYPQTGRSHQLRVHCAALGHPILGDPFYADAASRARRTRLCLHASALGFTHPDGGWRAFTDPVPF